MFSRGRPRWSGPPLTMGRVSAGIPWLPSYFGGNWLGNAFCPCNAIAPYKAVGVCLMLSCQPFCIGGALIERTPTIPSICCRYQKAQSKEDNPLNSPDGLTAGKSGDSSLVYALVSYKI